MRDIERALQGIEWQRRGTEMRGASGPAMEGEPANNPTFEERGCGYRPEPAAAFRFGKQAL